MDPKTPEHLSRSKDWWVCTIWTKLALNSWKQPKWLSDLHILKPSSVGSKQITHPNVTGNPIPSRNQLEAHNLPPWTPLTPPLFVLQPYWGELLNSWVSRSRSRCTLALPRKSAWKNRHPRRGSFRRRETWSQTPRPKDMILSRRGISFHHKKSTAKTLFQTAMFSEI